MQTQIGPPYYSQQEILNCVQASLEFFGLRRCEAYLLSRDIYIWTGHSLVLVIDHYERFGKNDLGLVTLVERLKTILNKLLIIDIHLDDPHDSVVAA